VIREQCSYDTKYHIGGRNANNKNKNKNKNNNEMNHILDGFNLFVSHSFDWSKDDVLVTSISSALFDGLSSVDGKPLIVESARKRRMIAVKISKKECET
jgi:hypothetical protein